MAASVEVNAVKGKIVRADDGTKVEVFRAVAQALLQKGAGKFGVGGAHDIHIYGAFTPGFRNILRNLHGNLHHGPDSQVHGAFAYAANIRKRHGNGHAHEKIVQASHDEDFVAVERLFRHFSGGRTVDALVDELMPRKLRGQRAPRFRTSDAVTVGKAVAYAKNIHDVASNAGDVSAVIMEPFLPLCKPPHTWKS